MKMKSVSSMFCAVAFFGTATMAMAGAYGEPEQAEEMPRSAPVAEEAAPMDDFSPFAYLAFGAVYAEEFFDGDAHLINDAYGWGWNGRVGYRFHEMLAIELFAEHIAEFDSDGGGNNSTDRRSWSLMPNLKFYPIEGFCEPYLSVGAGLFNGDHGHNWQIRSNGTLGQSDNIPGKTSGNGVDQGYGFGMRFGLGADFYATEQIFISPEVAYVLPLTEDINNYDYLSISLSLGYAFN